MALFHRDISMKAQAEWKHMQLSNHFTCHYFVPFLTICFHASLLICFFNMWHPPLSTSFPFLFLFSPRPFFVLPLLRFPYWSHLLRNLSQQWEVIFLFDADSKGNERAKEYKISQENIITRSSVLHACPSSIEKF